MVSAESQEWVFMTTGTDRGADLQSETPGDVELLRLAKARDVAALRQVILLYERRVLGTALRLLGHLDLAQDAAQEVFLRLFKHFGRYDEKRDFSPWLYQITVNVCRDMNRQTQKEKTLSLEELQADGEPMQVAAPVDLERELGFAEQRQLVEEALNSLPPRERETLVLRDLEGLSTREVAHILRSTQGTVRSQVSSARIKVKRFVERRMRRRP
jgi:RNA polymerase sigma-70 factor, ECF subfamily